MEEAKATRNHKNSVFTWLFGRQENLLEAYNALSGANYPKDTKVEIITLSDVLYMEQQNDIAFVIEDKLVVLIEHQSSINENMPLRMLVYIAREYEKIIDKRSLYKEKQIKIPTPEFIVLYNGKKEQPDYREMRLSDSFELRNEPFFLDLVVKVYNINKGYNSEISAKSPVLSEYSEFIAEINKNLQTMSRDLAVKTAIKACINREILLHFLREHGSEVENMLLTEWNMKDALEVRLEEGIAIGEARGLLQAARQMKAENMSSDLISRVIGLPKEDVERM